MIVDITDEDWAATIRRQLEGEAGPPAREAWGSWPSVVIQAEANRARRQTCGGYHADLDCCELCSPVVGELFVVRRT